MSLISRVNAVKHISIIISAGTKEGLEGLVSSNNMLYRDKGIVPFSEIMERWKYDFYLLSMDNNGMLQIRCMAADNSRRDIAAMFADINNVPSNLNCFDAVGRGRAYITAMDMNITRIENALLQALKVDVTPDVICLPHQKELY